MDKFISQETFDDIVKENIVEFSMDIAEAKEETIKQFEAQGINLANIIKDLSINQDTGRPVLNETIDRLKEISIETSLSGGEVPKLLKALAEECSKSVPHRVVRSRHRSLPWKLNHRIFSFSDGCQARRPGGSAGNIRNRFEVER